MPPRGDRIHLALLAVLAAASVLALTFSLHGLSVSTWHNAIDGSQHSEVLFGTARAIRSDDWLVSLGVALAQRSADPPFPAVNALIGDGQPMAVFAAAPLANALALFRPWTWGFFAGADTGMAWLWTFRLLGSVYAAFLACRRLSGGQSAVALPLALALAYAPMMQYWSLASADVVIAILLVYVGVGLALDGSTGLKRLAGGALSGWAAGTALNTMYPAHLVTAAFAGLALVSAALMAPPPAGGWRRRWWRAAPPAALAGAIAAAAALLLYEHIAASLPLIAATEYPGVRVETGGTLSLPVLLGGNLFNARGTQFWGVLANVCEEATFYWTFPVVFGVLLHSAATGRRRPSPAEACLAGVIGLLLVFGFLGLPRALAAATSLSAVPGPRLRFGLGLCDVLLVAAFAGAEHACARPSARTRVPYWSGAVVLCGLYAATWPALAAGVPSFRPLAAAALLGGLGALGYTLARAPRRGAAVLAAFSVASTAWFNPLVAGGAAFVLGNPLSAFIRAETADWARTHAAPAVWAAFGSAYTGHLFRMLGVRSASGVVFPPPFGLWRQLAPDGTPRAVYNRYANIVFEATPGLSRLESDQADRIVAQMNPDGPELRRAGITHLLVEGAPGVFAASHCFAPLFHYGKQTVWRRVRPPCSGPAAAAQPRVWRGRR